MNINPHNNQNQFAIIEAPRKSFNKEDTCPICLDNLNPHLYSALRLIAIHKGQDGIKHPMHAVCLKKSIQNNNSINNTQTGKCPVCRDTIYWKNPPALEEKIIALSSIITMATVTHVAFSYLTQMPMLMAVTPSAFQSLISINSIFTEHEKIGLEKPLTWEISHQVARSFVIIGTPLIASAFASHITDSRLLNSFITATLSTMCLSKFLLKEIYALKEL